MRFVVLLTVSNLFVLAMSQAPFHGKIVSCPILTQSVLRSMNFNSENEEMDWSLCTELTILDDEFVNVEGVSDIAYDEDMERILKLKEQHPRLKIFWAVGYHWFSVANIEKHNDFYGSFVKKIISREFDGVIVNFRDLRKSLLFSSEKDKVFEILKEVRKRLKKENLSLSSSFSLTFDDPQFDKSVFVKFSQHFDFIYYRQVGIDNQSRSYSFQYVLDEIKPANMQKKIERFIEWGVQPGKMIFGVDFGGPTTLVGSNTVEIGFIAYNIICGLIARNEPGKTMHTYDDEAQFATMTSIDAINRKHSIYYPTSRIIANLMRFAVKRNLAGVYADIMQNDDVHGSCFANTDTFVDFKPVEGITLKFPEYGLWKFPLMLSVNDALDFAVDELNQMNIVNQNITNENDPAQEIEFIPDQENQIGENKPTTTGTASCFKHTKFFIIAIIMHVIGLSSDHIFF